MPNNHRKYEVFPESPRNNIGSLATENRRDTFELHVKAAINSSVALATCGLQVLHMNQDPLYVWGYLCVVLQTNSTASKELP